MGIDLEVKVLLGLGHEDQSEALGVMKERVRRLEQIAGDLRSYLPGWKAYFRLAETPGVFRELDQWIRHRLRALQLKHWKRGRTVFREL
jgi:hypothetical protein